MSDFETLAKELRAKAKLYMNVGLTQNSQPHLTAALTLDGLGVSIERTIEINKSHNEHTTNH